MISVFVVAARSAALTMALAAFAAPSPGYAADDAQSARVERAQAIGADLEDTGARARLVFELAERPSSAGLDLSAFVLPDPDRVIVDARGLFFSVDPDIGKSAPAAAPRRRHRRTAPALAASFVKPGGLVASFRFGQIDGERSRIVIDLASPARVVKAVRETTDGGAERLVVELARTERGGFLSAAQSARQALGRADEAQTRISRAIEAANGRPVIMIDPGHGGIDRGATVNGLVEKDLVLEFGKALAARLKADGRFEPVLTREDDSFVALGERVRLARDRKVALFVSIHADILAEAADVSGATVYTLSDRASDAQAARLAEKENEADAAAGIERAEDAGDVSGILFDLTRRETRAYSHVFARTLLNYWKVVGRLNKNPQRSAGFRVLKAPDVPSVLLELGYLSNEKDDAELSSPQWRERAVTRMAEAIGAFFGERGAAPEKDMDPVGALAAAPVPAQDPEQAAAPDKPMRAKAAHAQK